MASYLNEIKFFASVNACDFPGSGDNQTGSSVTCLDLTASIIEDSNALDTDIVVALYDFRASMESQLSMHKGETLNSFSKVS